MPQNHYDVIGVMSGTSLDGIDLAHITFGKTDGRWDFTLHHASTIPYSEDWHSALQNAVNLDREALVALNESYTGMLGNTISQFIRSHNIASLDAVCSHGHTVLHQPAKGITLQIGNLPIMAEIIGQTVVCDFRVNDVRLGGQGAPLVPIGDRLLFGDYQYCVNLGGFSNVSFERDGRRIAFDISAVNTVLNHYALQAGVEFDDRGRLARSGSLSAELLARLDELDFYRKSYPKSLGYEFVRDILIPLIDSFQLSVPDVLHTFCLHIATQVAAALGTATGKILITGGGAYNDFLIEKITAALPDAQIVLPDNNVIQFKEAIIFGLLGIIRLRGEINVLSSVTGASRDHSSGTIYKPNKIHESIA